MKPIATTRIIALHRNKGKTIAKCLTARIAYAKNPEKTNNEELISAYECDPHTADAEFLFSKRQYRTITGRDRENDVIAYQIRQSFKHGEITPEEANQIGYELAMRFLKGKHAFLVCTHVDKDHIHSHIIFNSTTLDCTHKFRDFLGSGRAVAKLSDIICLEHGLSIIEKPKRYTHSTYDKWLGNRAKPSHREVIRRAIDEIFTKKPADFEMFIKLLTEAGYTVRKGQHLTLQHSDFKKAIRLDSLGEGYTEAELRSVLSGEKEHTPKKRRNILAPQKNDLLIDIEAKLREGKGKGYERWAKVHNLKQMAQTINYLREHGLLDYDELKKKSSELTARYHELSDRIKSAEARIKEISELRTQIINYAKTRDVYATYKKYGYSKEFLSAHESEILLHKAAKKAFDAMNLTKLPTVKCLNEEYAELVSQKKALYPEYSEVRAEMRELLIHKSNVEKILGIDDNQPEKQPEHER